MHPQVLTTPSIDKSCIHLHIYQPLPSKETPVSYHLTNIEEGQTLDSPIVPFSIIFPPLEPGPVIPPSKPLPFPGPGPVIPGLTAAKTADARVDAITYQVYIFPKSSRVSQSIRGVKAAQNSREIWVKLHVFKCTKLVAIHLFTLV